MSAEKGENSYDVIIIGAGISGINAAYRLQERCPQLNYTILENRDEIGGTWSLFKYPGIRSDSDLYTFGFPWRPWEDRSAIAEGPKILAYMKESASMYGIDKKIQYKHEVHSVNWSSKQTSWSIDATANGTTKKTFSARFLMLCTGYYDYTTPMKAPIPGIDDFAGQVIHPQFWPADLDYTGKNIVVVGSGATSVTLLPNLAPKASHVTMLQRSPSYVVSQPKEDGMEKAIRRWFGERWQHTLIRWKAIFFPWLFVRICLNWPSFARSMILKGTAKQLPPGVPIDPNFLPTYNPFEQRVCLCPDADFYKALRTGKASVETGVISTVTRDTIELQSGKQLRPDIIVTATGLKVVFCGGISVSVDGKPFQPGEKFVWKGVMLEDMPNAAFSMGYVDASWTLGADATAQMVCRLLNRMGKTRMDVIVPRRSEKEKREMHEEPLIRLNSTYVEKARGTTPKCGDRGQWQRRSYYYWDILVAWFGDINKNLEWKRTTS